MGYRLFSDSTRFYLTGEPKQWQNDIYGVHDLLFYICSWISPCTFNCWCRYQCIILVWMYNHMVVDTWYSWQSFFLFLAICFLSKVQCINMFSSGIFTSSNSSTNLSKDIYKFCRGFIDFRPSRHHFWLWWTIWGKFPNYWYSDILFIVNGGTSFLLESGQVTWCTRYNRFGSWQNFVKNF